MNPLDKDVLIELTNILIRGRFFKFILVRFGIPSGTWFNFRRGGQDGYTHSSSTDLTCSLDALSPAFFDWLDVS